MFLSAVSFSLLLSGPQAGPTPDRKDLVFARVASSVVALQEDGFGGAAALIDKAGFFVAHQSIVQRDVVTGRWADGRTIQLKVRSRDRATGLVLLEASGFNDPKAQPVALALNPPAPGTPITLVVANGAFRGNFISERLGIDRQQNRLLLLSELRFEAPDSVTRGALLFSPNGELVGTMGAVLARAESSSAAKTNGLTRGIAGSGLGAGVRFPGSDSGGNGIPKVVPPSVGPANSGPANDVSQGYGQQGQFQGGLGGANQAARFQTNQMGPGQMTVAFGTGFDMFRKVAQGFLSQDRKVEYAMLGIICRDAVAGGALIQTVVAGSPAAQIGVRPNDELIGLGVHDIRNQIDFAKAMLQHAPGEKLSLRIRRKGQILLTEVVLGRAAGL